MARLLGVIIPFGVFVGLAATMITVIQFSAGTSIARLPMPQSSTQQQ